LKWPARLRAGNQAKDLFEYVLGASAIGVNRMRVLRGSQWGYQPAAVGGVAVRDLALQHGVVVVAHLQRASAFALLFRGGYEDLEVGVGEHHSSDVTPHHDHTIAPIASLTPTLPGDFTLSGLRLPLLVISPWVKPHFVSHVPREFTSILKLIEVRFGLPSLTARDAAADDMTEFFDFTRPAWLTPPQLPVQPTNGTCDWKLEALP